MPRPKKKALWGSTSKEIREALSEVLRFRCEHKDCFRVFPSIYSVKMHILKTKRHQQSDLMFSEVLLSAPKPGHARTVRGVVRIVAQHVRGLGRVEGVFGQEAAAEAGYDMGGGVSEESESAMGSDSESWSRRRSAAVSGMIARDWAGGPRPGAAGPVSFKSVEEGIQNMCGRARAAGGVAQEEESNSDSEGRCAFFFILKTVLCMSFNMSELLKNIYELFFNG